jgi:hypothetical protein
MQNLFSHQMQALSHQSARQLQHGLAGFASGAGCVDGFKGKSEVDDKLFQL